MSESIRQFQSDQPEPQTRNFLRRYWREATALGLAAASLVPASYIYHEGLSHPRKTNSTAEVSLGNRTVPLDKIRQEAIKMDRRFQVFDHPLAGVGGYPAGEVNQNTFDDTKNFESKDIQLIADLRES